MAYMNTSNANTLHPHMQGQIQVILGPMFSGKTTELIRRMKRFAVAEQQCLIIKYGKDTRYSIDGVSTHDGQVAAAKSCAELAEIKEDAKEYGVIGIDEGQFFPDIVSFCEEMANSGKTVIVAALDGTFQRKAFGHVLELIPLAGSVVKLTAVCMRCHGDAPFSRRLGSETEIEVIGGAEKYVAMCRSCFFDQPSTTATPETNTKRCQGENLLHQESDKSAQKQLFAS